METGETDGRRRQGRQTVLVWFTDGWLCFQVDVLPFIISSTKKQVSRRENT